MKYEDIYSFTNENLAIVFINKKYGCITRDGVEIIPCIYDYIYDYCNGYTIGRILDDCYIFNTKGEITGKFKNKYNLGTFNNYNICKVTTSDCIGYINTKGNEVIPCIYKKSDPNQFNEIYNNAIKNIIRANKIHTIL